MFDKYKVIRNMTGPCPFGGTELARPLNNDQRTFSKTESQQFNIDIIVNGVDLLIGCCQRPPQRIRSIRQNT